MQYTTRPSPPFPLLGYTNRLVDRSTARTKRRTILARRSVDILLTNTHTRTDSPPFIEAGARFFLSLWWRNQGGQFPGYQRAQNSFTENIYHE